MTIKRFSSHSKFVQDITTKYGWGVGTRYTNIRDVKTYGKVDFVDIDWKDYNFKRHLLAVESLKPHITIARDVESILDLEEILKEASLLKKFSDRVAIVLKDTEFNYVNLDDYIPKELMLAYSVKSKYGGTEVKLEKFERETHLLGGHPRDQINLKSKVNVYSFDCNRFTLDAKFGYYFSDGKFIRDRSLGYRECLTRSVININKSWGAL